MTDVIEQPPPRRKPHLSPDGRIERPSDDPQAARYGHIHTAISRRVALWMIVNFILLISAVPLYQAAVEISHRMRPRVTDLFVRSTFPNKHELQLYETSLRDTSLTRLYFQPRVQQLVTGALAAGNSSVVVGREGWLFFRPGVDYVTGPDFTSTYWQHKRGNELIDTGAGDRSCVDPIATITDFNQQCAAAGAKLIIVPIPDKSMLQPAQLSSSFAGNSEIMVPNNPGYAGFLSRLRDAGVAVFDPTPTTVAPSAARFLVHDTHWTPTWMQEVADQLARQIAPRLDTSDREPMQIRPATVDGMGDLAELLRLLPQQKLFDPQQVRREQVVGPDGKIIRSRINSPVLLMGDSFTNIFSDGQMGWGEGAGFAEHLAYALGQAIDRLSRNDAGANATRQMLADEMARGRDHLSGKKVVVWEFAMRELAVGNWKHIKIEPKPPPPLASSQSEEFLMLKSGETLTASGEIKAIAAPPVPGSAPYKDHIIGMQLVDLRDSAGKPVAARSAVVFVWSMRDQQLTDAARLRPGARITLKLKPWSDLEPKLGTINRRELDDDSLILVEPCWGELVK
ncbi:MAG TPA: hypothetical protein VL282_02490 [Tepidisphaeraceae bacterium]|nr:hypothetical protein [Tepidisphaeraceae bacterium]